MLFMESETAGELEQIADACAASSYAIEEIEQILFNEVPPACRFNLLYPTAPEWTGFEIDFLVARILKTHRFGKRRPLLMRRYTSEWWRRLQPMIVDRRRPAHAAVPNEPPARQGTEPC